MSDKCPWFVVVRLDKEIFHKVLIQDTTALCYSTKSIRQPHVGSAERYLVPPENLLPEVELRRGIGEYMFILSNMDDAMRRVTKLELSSPADLFSFKLPTNSNMNLGP